MVELDANRLEYLQALARQARKRIDKKIDRFAAKPGQTPEEVDTARTKLMLARVYAAETEELLRQLRSKKFL